MHGKQEIKHVKGLFKNIKNNFEATRYHSLIKRKTFKNLMATAETKDWTIMGLMHKL